MQRSQPQLSDLIMYTEGSYTKGELVIKSKSGGKGTQWAYREREVGSLPVFHYTDMESFGSPSLRANCLDLWEMASVDVPLEATVWQGKIPPCIPVAKECTVSVVGWQARGSNKSA